jgi:hypothetical protein
VTELARAALATWALAWALAFWHKLDPLRERLGVMPTYDADGYQVDRLDAGGLGGWLNCPLCAAVLAFPVGWLLRRWLSPLGLALLIVRWWEGARVKREWWT